MVAAITAAYDAARPGRLRSISLHSSEFRDRRLAQYTSLISQIKTTYARHAGRSIREHLRDAGAGAGSEPDHAADVLARHQRGHRSDVGDKQTIDKQIKTHAIKVYVYNSQNATPDVQAQVDEAKAAGIPVTTITETLSPASATFQDWQVAQLLALQAALKTAKGPAHDATAAQRVSAVSFAMQPSALATGCSGTTSTSMFRPASSSRSSARTASGNRP